MAFLPDALRILSAIYGMKWRNGPRLRCDRRIALHRIWLAVLDWLIGNYEFFGLTGQRWIPVFAGALLLYIAVLIIAQRCKTNAR